MNLTRINHEFDISKIQTEINSNLELWDANTRRQESIDRHRHTKQIPLRDFNPNKVPKGTLHWDIHPSKTTKESRKFPDTLKAIRNFCKANKYEIGRVNLVKLEAEKRVYEHCDRGHYYWIRDRFHLAVESQGTELKSGDNTALIKEGELWVFDNKLYHESHNKTKFPRVHLIFDAKPLNHTGYYCYSLDKYTHTGKTSPEQKADISQFSSKK